MPDYLKEIAIPSRGSLYQLLEENKYVSACKGNADKVSNVYYGNSCI